MFLKEVGKPISAREEGKNFEPYYSFVVEREQTDGRTEGQKLQNMYIMMS
jgi:hypothetical protein